MKKFLLTLLSNKRLATKVVLQSNLKHHLHRHGNPQGNYSKGYREATGTNQIEVAPIWILEVHL